MLSDISKMIPVCIISSKDYHFLHPRTKFARILSCIMGIETVTLKTHKKEGQSSKRKERWGDTSYCIEESHLMLNDDQTLRANSSLLAGLAENISAFILYMTNGIIRVLAILPILMQSLIF